MKFFTIAMLAASAVAITIQEAPPAGIPEEMPKEPVTAEMCLAIIQQFNDGDDKITEEEFCTVATEVFRADAKWPCAAEYARVVSDLGDDISPPAFAAQMAKEVNEHIAAAKKGDARPAPMPMLAEAGKGQGNGLLGKAKRAAQKLRKEGKEAGVDKDVRQAEAKKLVKAAKKEVKARKAAAELAEESSNDVSDQEPRSGADSMFATDSCNDSEMFSDDSGDASEEEKPGKGQGNGKLGKAKRAAQKLRQTLKEQGVSKEERQAAAKKIVKAAKKAVKARKAAATLAQESDSDSEEEKPGKGQGNGKLGKAKRAAQKMRQELKEQGVSKEDRQAAAKKVVKAAKKAVKARKAAAAASDDEEEREEPAQKEGKGPKKN